MLLCWIIVLVIKKSSAQQVNTNVRCPNSWFQSADSCYLYKNISKSYQDALSSCESYGGSLLSIKDKVENDFISNFISTNNLQGTDIWIGLNDIKNRAQRKFEWSDGTPISFTYWRSGEPNNYMENEDCVVLYKGWNDDVCAKNKSYICEINKDSTDPCSLCSVNAQCVTADGVRQCVCNNGFIGNGTTCAVNTNIKCPNSWFQSADSCYLYKNISKSYQDALSSCESYGGSLLSIKDKVENDFISNFISTNNLQGTDFWIGLNDIKNRAQKKFEWSDGTPLSFTNWRSGEPNNYMENEDCVVLYNGWNDDVCAKNKSYICEINTGSLSPWSFWGTCSASCKSQVIGPYQYRNRSCVDFFSFDPNFIGCFNSSLNEQQLCNQNYSCTVLQVSSSSAKDKTLMIAILVPVVACLFIFLIVFVIRRKRNRVRFRQSKKHDVCITEPNIYSDEKLADIWEIFPENIILDKKIGEGAFGTVFSAKIKGDLTTGVAVKYLKDSADQSEFNDFCEEIKLMKEIGKHKNIVNMIGCCTIKKPLCLVVEFMENGDLLHFLRDRKSILSSSKVDQMSGDAASFMYVEQQTVEASINKNCSLGVMANEISLKNIEVITPNDMLSFAWQIASGMEYLTCKKLVHRDLAARNILVGAKKNIKISDFGLTRRVNNDLNYMSNKNRRLPVKWMSVEAIFHQKFTSYSDVWAYGVVLFEIVTLGGTPYATLNNRELFTFLKSGNRMERPENCSKIIYDIMLDCWNEDPLQRPTFTKLREHLDRIISQGDCYLSFEVDEKNICHSVASFISLPSKTDDNPIEEEISVIATSC